MYILKLTDRQACSVGPGAKSEVYDCLVLGFSGSAQLCWYIQIIGVRPTWLLPGEGRRFLWLLLRTLCHWLGGGTVEIVRTQRTPWVGHCAHSAHGPVTSAARRAAAAELVPVTMATAGRPPTHGTLYQLRRARCSWFGYVGAQFAPRRRRAICRLLLRYEQYISVNALLKPRSPVFIFTFPSPLLSSAPLRSRPPLRQRVWRAHKLPQLNSTTRTRPDPHGPNGVSPQKKSVRVRAGPCSGI